MRNINEIHTDTNIVKIKVIKSASRYEMIDLSADE